MQGKQKIFILDTNVLIHDPRAIVQFEDNDVVLPIVVLEEMDKVKRGFDELARNVREVSRMLDEFTENRTDLSEGCPLPGGGRLFFELGRDGEVELPAALDLGRNDNRIIALTMALQKEHAGRPVVIVSKDINLRVKARALGLEAEDYQSDQVVQDDAVLPSGYMSFSGDDWISLGQDMSIEHGKDYHIQWPEELPRPSVNSFVLLPDGQLLRCMKVKENTVQLQAIHGYSSQRNAVWGIQAKNPGQNMAMNLLMDTNLDLVTLLGQAGTGKTLLALACGLHQCMEDGLYEKILVTRATVPLGQDIGYLPGTEKEKMEPWMGAISDNLSMLLAKDFMGLNNLEQFRIEIAALSFARGRTFHKTWLIVDEAQNLTPHQMKSLITRMGEGSKIIILGNNAQIDTPYLTTYSNGLSMAIMRFRDWQFAGHVTLESSERSRLAAYAVEVL